MPAVNIIFEKTAGPQKEPAAFLMIILKMTSDHPRSGAEQYRGVETGRLENGLSICRNCDGVAVPGTVGALIVHHFDHTVRRLDACRQARYALGVARLYFEAAEARA